MAKMNWNRDETYSSLKLGSFDTVSSDPLGYVAPAKFRTDKAITESTALAEGRATAAHKRQQTAAATSAAMSALGLLSAHSVAKRAKRQVESTYKSNIRAIEMNVEGSELDIAGTEMAGRKNIYSMLNKAKGDVTANLLRDPRALSTAKMSEVQGAEGRISQSADIALASGKMSAAAAKGELNLQTILAKGQQEEERWRQKAAIEGEKSAAITKGVTDIAMAAAMM